jgi:hypothetical protein
MHFNNKSVQQRVKKSYENTCISYTSLLRDLLIIFLHFMLLFFKLCLILSRSEHNQLGYKIKQCGCMSGIVSILNNR